MIINREEQVKNNDDEMMSVNSHIVAVNDAVNQPEQQQHSVKKERLFQAKQKRNRKRNRQLRLTRLKYYFKRPYYYRFK